MYGRLWCFLWKLLLSILDTICSWGSHICFDVVFCLFLFEWVSTGWRVQGCLADFGFCGKPASVCQGIVLCNLANGAKYASFS